jgi:hypothetical protein
MMCFNTLYHACCPWAHENDIISNFSSRTKSKCSRNLIYLLRLLKESNKTYPESEWSNIYRAIIQVIDDVCENMTTHSERVTVLHIANALPEIYNKQILSLLDVCFVFPDTYDAVQINSLINSFETRDAVCAVDYIHINLNKI